ncbi:ATP synthase F1 subunit gamma [Candidatus Sumerlaeota bacterium]
MAENPKVLRRRIRSIGSTRKITRAMEMVSAAKLRRTQGIMSSGLPYADKLQELLGRLASAAGEFGHPLFRKPEASKTALVLFTGDRGLCGSFNNNIIEDAGRFIEERGKDNVCVYAIGRKGRDFCRKLGCELVGEVVGLSGQVDGEATRQAANDLRELFLSGQTREVFLLYNRFISQIEYRQTLAQFLPLEAEALLGEPAEGEETADGEIDYLFEPGREQLFAQLLPRYLESRMYITLAMAFTAEHSARMMAMSSATKNCGELIDSLTLKMNKARQAAITKEILEVVGGAEALSG